MVHRQALPIHFLGLPAPLAAMTIPDADLFRALVPRRPTVRILVAPIERVTFTAVLLRDAGAATKHLRDALHSPGGSPDGRAARRAWRSQHRGTLQPHKIGRASCSERVYI